MENKTFQMLKIYKQDFPEKMSKVSKTEVIAHYYEKLKEVKDKGIKDKLDVSSDKLLI